MVKRSILIIKKYKTGAFHWLEDYAENTDP